MGVVTDLYAFETAAFERLRKDRRIAALASALVDNEEPPIAIRERTSIDKAHFDHFAMLVEMAFASHLRAAAVRARFLEWGRRRIAHRHAELYYWDPFYALSAFDDFDQIADRLVTKKQTKVIRRVGGTELLQQPGDPFRLDVWAYRKSDLAKVFAITRDALSRKKYDEAAFDGYGSELVIDAWFAVLAFFHRAFEPLTPVGRRGKTWTIVSETR